MSKRTFEGKIVKNKMQSTVVVEVDVPKKHAIYGKSIPSSTKLLARNLINATLGDYVTIQECAPYSKHCTWEVIKKLEVVEK